MNAEHPFAKFVRILGRGRTLSRSLTMEEAEAAMGMILRGEFEDDYAAAAVTGTLAIALRTLGRARDVETAQARDKGWLGIAA